MKLYNSIGPNPRMVRMYLIEKGLELPVVEHDLLGMENRKKPYLDKNPGGQMPALELDNDKIIGETVAICEYLEELYPQPVLIGSNAEERANHRQWQRRIELNITEHLYNSFRYGPGIDIFRERMRVLPEATKGLSEIVQDKLSWLNDQMDERDYISGNEIKVVDMILYSALDFGAGVGQEIDPQLANIVNWFDRIDARESAKNSKHPRTEEIGMRGA